MDYAKMLAFHQGKLADLTVGAVAVDKGGASSFGVLSVDDDDRITGFDEKPADPITIPYQPDKAYASMGVYIFDTRLMYSILEEDARADTSHDFGRDVIPAMAKEYRVYAFPFGRDETLPDREYWRDVGTIDAYWEANMDLCGVTPAFNLYDEAWPLHTYQGQHPPAKTVFAFFDQNRAGMALNSLVCSGVIISGAKVSRSVLSPRVHIHSYAEVEDSVLLNGVDVGRSARIRRAIIDKYVRIPPGEMIGIDLDRDRKRFYVSEGGVVVIPKGTVL
jgi:glucose-1-phosphate adenylyltransferase